MGRVLQVSVGPVRTVTIGGRPVRTGIVKDPVDHPVLLADHHVAGDHQASKLHHGGRWQALYAYARETYDRWEAELDRKLPSGFWGENLTLSGIDSDYACIGEQWQVGEALLGVTAPRIPCKKLGWRMDDPSFVTRFLHGDRPGAYLQILAPGHVAAGDDVEVVHRTTHDVTVLDMMRLWRGERELADHVLTAGDDLTPEERTFAQRHATSARTAPA